MPGGFADWNAESGEAVGNGNADLELGNLTVELPGGHPPARQFYAMHLRIDAALAVVNAPSLSDLPA